MPFQGAITVPKWVANMALDSMLQELDFWRFGAAEKAL